MSGISGSGNSGRHVASHAKPGKMSNAKGKARTAAAVTSVLAVSGGVATALHLHQDALRNSTEAASRDSSSSGVAAAAAALSARSAAAGAVNRDSQRPDLDSTTASGAPTSSATEPSAPAPSSDAPSVQPASATGSASAPVSSSSTSAKPPAPTSTSTTTKPTATPTPTKPTTTTPPATSSSSSSSVGMGYNATPAQAQAIAKAIVPSGQYACFANIISRESSWNVHAVNPSSGAYGLAQALPGNKMATYGADWRNSATIQIKWALSYMTGRYGSPCAAWAFWQNHNWY